MDKIIEILKINWVHQLIGAGLFVLGAILGAIAVSIIWKRFTLREKEENKIKKDVSYITQNAISVYENGNSKLSLEKITYICQAIAYLLKEIPQEYGNSRVYDVIKKEDFKIANKQILLSDLKLHLDFTVYELLSFINSTAEQLKVEVYRLLNSRVGKMAIGAGRLLLKNRLQEGEREKDLDDITLSALVSLVSSLTAKTEEKEESKLKAFFKPVADRLKNAALDVANGYLEVYVKEIIEIFASEINNLYSGQHKAVSLEKAARSFIEEEV